MEEIKRYRCVKECSFEKCDGDGFFIENEYTYVSPGSIWQENKHLIAGGPEEADPNKNTSGVQKLLSALSEGKCKGIKGATAYKVAQFAAEMGLI